MDINLLNEMMRKGYVIKRKHPTAELWILNYTADTQFDRVWNEVTLACRGLIVDKNFNIVSRCVEKFFNIEEMASQNPPLTQRLSFIRQVSNKIDFEITKKMDGSLGTLYFLDGKPYIATRGCFDGERAVKANEMIKRYDASKLNPNYSYLFEIIYPENRVVLDYGKTEDLFLITMFETKSGRELTYDEMLANNDAGFPVVERLDGVTSIDELKGLNTPNEEGFVIRFPDGLRVKVKFEDYLTLHKCMFSVTTKRIWEWMMAGEHRDDLLERMPDEQYEVIKKLIDDFQAKYNEIETAAKELFEKYEFKLGKTQAQSRKEFAAYMADSPYRALAFLMLDNRPYDKAIWKMIEPDENMLVWKMARQPKGE